MEENLRQEARRDESSVAVALRSARESGAMVEIGSDRENTGLLQTGYVADVDASTVLLLTVTPGGHYCGFMVKQLERIYRVVTGSRDAQRAEKLFQMRGVRHDTVESCAGGNIPALLQYAKRTGKVVSIELLESDQWDFMGFVADVDAHAVTIRQVTNYGEDDGVCVVYLADITELSCDDDGEIAARLLHENGPV